MGRQLHVCARCTGLVVGLAFVPFVALLGRASLPLAIGAIAVLALDTITQLSGCRQSNNALRFTTGILAGSLVPAAVLNLIWSAFVNA